MERASIETVRPSTVTTTSGGGGAPRRTTTDGDTVAGTTGLRNLHHAPLDDEEAGLAASASPPRYESATGVSTSSSSRASPASSVVRPPTYSRHASYAHRSGDHRIAMDSRPKADRRTWWGWLTSPSPAAGSSKRSNSKAAYTALPTGNSSTLAYQDDDEEDEDDDDARTITSRSPQRLAVTGSGRGRSPRRRRSGRGRRLRGAFAAEDASAYNEKDAQEEDVSVNDHVEGGSDTATDDNSVGSSSHCHHCGTELDAVDFEGARGATSRSSWIRRIWRTKRRTHHPAYSTRRLSRRYDHHHQTPLESLLELCFILIPILAACTLSFALGVSFEIIRNSILEAKGNGRHHRHHGGAWYDAHRYHRVNGWEGYRPADWFDAAPAGRVKPSSPETAAASGSGAVQHTAAPTGCSVMDLALARLTPTEALRIHSHNDETRDKPLTEALSYGALSVEADVWLMPTSPKLYVGHEIESLTETATLPALYIDPLVKILEQRNSASNSSARSRDGKSTPWNGVYENAPNQTLYLFLDIKSESLPTWNAVLEALEPLRSRGWLTRWQNGKDLIWGPITVIGTGDAPVEHVAPLLNRDVFIDAPVADLASGDKGRGPEIKGIDGNVYEYNSTLSPIASGNWLTSVGYLGLLPATASTRQAVRSMSDTAHARGMHVRWWNNPAWPIFARDRAWRLMLDEEVDFLNADDLEGAVDVLIDSGLPRQLPDLSPPHALR